MKKIALFALSVMLIVALASCSDSDNQREYYPSAIEPSVSPTPEPTTEPESVAEVPEPTPEPIAEPLEPELAPIIISAGAVTNDFNAIGATEWVANIRIGLNLGNTFDTYSGTGGFSWLGGGVYADTTVSQMETAWGNPVTTRENIEAIRGAGFNAIRIPVSWHKAADEQYIIREDWMARIIEVVDYAVDNEMKIILNTHHDNSIFRLRDRYMEDSKIALERIWTQIAYAFRDYNELLIFEGLNEPRTIGTPGEWSGGTDEERNNLNILNQLFVDTVRRTGGNNTLRVLMIPTYAASSSATAQYALVMPTDTVEDKIIVSIHMYSPWEFALRTGPDANVTEWSSDRPSDTQPITGPLRLAHDLFVNNGIPVIFDEMGALNRGYEEVRADWAYFYVSYARSLDIPCFWWDNGEYWPSMEHEWGWDETFGLLNRRTNEFAHPLIIDALMRATE